MTVTPEFLFDLESRMQVITERDYAAFSRNLWWSRLMKTRESKSRREMLAWLLSTAQIYDMGKDGGNMQFDELVSKTTEFENRFAGAGLKLKKSELEDLDGSGLDLATAWASDIASQMAYWPQKKLVELMKNGHSAGYESYDGKTFFASDHPVNPFNAGAGTFQNIFTGAASGAYPGACPISGVTIDVARTNLSKIIAYIKGIKMPNGVDPRFLRPRIIVAGPALEETVVQLTSSKYIAQGAASGGGSGDVEAVIQSRNFEPPIIADELGGDFESGTTFFVGCDMADRQIGPFVYVDREPFKITYYTGEGGGTGVDRDLSRMDELEWHAKGRNVAGFGHPFLFFKCKAS